MSPQCLPPSFSSIQHTIQEQMSFQDFQDGHCSCHLDSEQNDFSHSESLRCSDASHQVSAKFDLQFGRRCHLKISRWPTWQPSWILEWNNFNNSKPSCGPNAIHQVWAQSDLGFQSRCGFKIFKMAAQACGPPMLPIKFRLNPTYGLGGDVV